MKGKENDTRSAISTDDLGNIAFSDNCSRSSVDFNTTLLRH